MSGKRRKRRKRYIRNLLWILTVALILSAAFVCLFMFRVTDIKVTGNCHESDKEVAAMIQKGPLRDNTLFLCLAFNDRKIKGNTFVDSVDVAYVKHDTVNVTVKEKSLVGYVKYDDRYWYFDRKGVVRVGSVMNESGYKALQSGQMLPGDSVSGQAAVNGAPDENKSDPALNDSESNLNSAKDTSESAPEESDSSAYHVKSVNYLTDEETYVDPDTAEYEEDYGDDTDYEEDYDGDGGYDGNADYDEGYDTDEDTGDYDNYEEYSEEDGDWEEEGDEETILIQPELMDDTSPTPIPADESSVSSVTPIPAEEVLVKEYTSEDTFAENYIPEITGLVLSGAAVGERLPVKYSSIYEALGALKTFAEENSIYPTSVDVSDKGNLQLHFNDVTVNLGDGSHIEKRLDVFKHIIYELLGRSGTLHLEKYDGTQSRLIFSKNEKNS